VSVTDFASDLANARARFFRQNLPKSCLVITNRDVETDEAIIFCFGEGYKQFIMPRLAQTSFPKRVLNTSLNR